MQQIYLTFICGKGIWQRNSKRLNNIYSLFEIDDPCLAGRISCILLFTCYFIYKIYILYRLNTYTV